MDSNSCKALFLQPWGGEAGRRLVERCASEQGMSCDVIQENLPFDWDSPWGKLRQWYGPSIRVAIKGLRRRAGKDVILAFDPMCGLIFASLARFLRLDHPPVVVSMFLLRPWKYRWLDRLRSAFANYGLARVRTIICFSSYEVERYRKEFTAHADKIFFVPVGADPTALDLEQEKQRVSRSQPEEYVFSGGTTNRDYHTLARAMAEIPDSKVVILAKPDDYPFFIKNLEFKDDIYGIGYEREIFDATLVVLPLFDRCFSSGQLTMLRAMELGKAIIASDVPGVRDYITDKQNGILVPAGDAQALRVAIKLLIGDAAERERLGANAQKAHAEKFTQRMSVSSIIAFAVKAAKSGEQAGQV